MGSQKGLSKCIGDAGELWLSLPVKSEDEVGRLALGYNRMVKSVKNAEGNFKAPAENANDAILILSKEGRVVCTNTRAAEISGYSPVDLRKKHFSEVIHPDELAVVERRFAARIDGRTAPRCYESVILNRKGEVVPVEITGARTIWHDEPADVVIIRDISERKRAEELLQAQQQQLLRADKLASPGALVAGVAHEINKPNQVVSMDACFLGEGLPGLFVLAESGEQADDRVRIAGVGYSEFKQSAEAAISEISARHGKNRSHCP